jgi:hypothetical protein
MSKDITTTDNSEVEIIQLKPKMEMFCQLYASDKEFFANGTQSYIEAYDVDTSKPNYYKTAQAAASRLLSNVKVLERINQLLDLRGLNDQFVDKQLEFLVTQNTDLKTKMSAIKEYNVMKARTAKATGGGNTYNTFIQNNNINPNEPQNRVKIDRITEMLMEDTKRG